jgi:phosphoglycerate dehydrogenase-like enzyme
VQLLGDSDKAADLRQRVVHARKVSNDADFVVACIIESAYSASMPKVAVAMTPARADDVCDAETRQLLESRFEVSWGSAGFGPAELPTLVAGADLVLTSWGTPRLSADLLTNRPLVVAHAAGTVKNLLDPALLQDGVTVFSAATRIAWSVGEYCLSAMLTLLRRLPQFDASMRASRWRPAGLRGAELRGRRVGIVGASSTARALITLLQPFQPEIVVYDPYLTVDRAADLGVSVASLEEVAACDILSIHVPNLPATQGIITRALLEKMPDGGIVINSSRAPSVGNEALYAEITSGRLYAALDVFAPEPPTLPDAITASDHVLLTPHIAGDTVEGHLALARYVVTDALAWLENGSRGPSYVDPAQWAIAA